MASQNDQRRTVLPIPDPPAHGADQLRCQGAKYPPIAGTLKLNGYATAPLGKCIP
jgi:hypothetical protein